MLSDELVNFILGTTRNILKNIIAKYIFFIRMDDIFLPRRLNISSTWTKYSFWWMKYFVHVNENIPHCK
jgi:hypothetical protein